MDDLFWRNAENPIDFYFFENHLVSFPTILRPMQPDQKEGTSMNQLTSLEIKWRDSSKIQ